MRISVRNPPATTCEPLGYSIVLEQRSNNPPHGRDRGLHENALARHEHGYIPYDYAHHANALRRHGYGHHDYGLHGYGLHGYDLHGNDHHCISCDYEPADHVHDHLLYVIHQYS